MLKEYHGMDIFMAALNFLNLSEAQGQQGCTLNTWEIPLRECWVLNIIITLDLVGHSITQQTIVGGGSVLEHSWGPQKAVDRSATIQLPTVPSCSLGSHQPLKDCPTAAWWTVALKIKIYCICLLIDFCQQSHVASSCPSTRLPKFEP